MQDLGIYCFVPAFLLEDKQKSFFTIILRIKKIIRCVEDQFFAKNKNQTAKG